jgi:hypothetical protein
VALVDGANHQIQRIRLEARKRDITVTMVLKARAGDRARELLESHVLWARDLAIEHLRLVRTDR